jgi:DDE superfamily endonuclease
MARREGVMDDAKALWRRWQRLMNRFTLCFTRPGWVRFMQWVTGTVLCWEEHTITQILTAMGLESRWRVLESFAEYGAFDCEAVERLTIQVIEEQQPARWAGYHPVALDDTKEHRTSEKVWGTCTFHEPASRSPNRAETVRAHNWVVLGDLVAGEPWTYLPHTARLYFRDSQLPEGETFCKKTEWAVVMLRQVDAESPVPILAVFDGAYANETVIEPCLNPQEGQRRIEIVTRLRVDARLYRPKVANAKGRPRVWGRRLPAPQKHAQWDALWKKGQAYIYGRQRQFEYKQLACFWSVSGPDSPVHVFVFQVEGYKEPWYIVTTALELSAAQVVEVFAARYRQEDGFRDHKQRLGMEECRAWTKAPILRTFRVQMVAQTMLRLLQFQLDADCGPATWWSPPDWNRKKKHPSILDLRRLLWRQREHFSHFLVELEELPKVEPEPGTVLA